MKNIFSLQMNVGKKSAPLQKLSTPLARDLLHPVSKPNTFWSFYHWNSFSSSQKTKKQEFRRQKVIVLALFYWILHRKHAAHLISVSAAIKLRWFFLLFKLITVIQPCEGTMIDEFGNYCTRKKFQLTEQNMVKPIAIVYGLLAPEWRNSVWQKTHFLKAAFVRKSAALTACHEKNNCATPKVV